MPPKPTPRAVVRVAPSPLCNQNTTRSSSSRTVTSFSRIHTRPHRSPQLWIHWRRSLPWLVCLVLSKCRLQHAWVHHLEHPEELELSRWFYEDYRVLFFVLPAISPISFVSLGTSPPAHHSLIGAQTKAPVPGNHNNFESADRLAIPHNSIHSHFVSQPTAR